MSQCLDYPEKNPPFNSCFLKIALGILSARQLYRDPQIANVISQYVIQSCLERK